MDIRKILVGVFSACVGVVFLKWLIFTLANPWWPDFSVFWTAARMPALAYDDQALTAAQSWLPGVGDGLRPWAYPPSALLPILPFAQLPFYVAFAAFTGLTFAAFLWASRNIVSGWRAYLLLIAASPVFFVARGGQMTFLIGALVITGLALLPSRAVLAGVLIGIAAAIKPPLLVLAPLAFIAARRPDALAAAVLSGGAMLLASLALGPSLWVEWFKAMPRFLETVTVLDLWGSGVTPSAIMWNIGLGGAPQVAVAIAFAGLAALAVWNVFRRTDDLSLRLVALIGGGLLSAPYAMNYELALLAPVAAVLLLKKDAPLTLVIASGLLLVLDGVFTPPVAIAFIVLVLRDYYSMISIANQVRSLLRSMEMSAQSKTSSK